MQPRLTLVTADAVIINTAIVYTYPAWVQHPSSLTGFHTDRLICGLAVHGLYTVQLYSDVIIASLTVGVVNSPACDNCSQV